ncbi:hypothetical protein ONZ43_g1538 [Nemania bipapillata]|uniref:Uncharacterized protein n=1 Tax=Nemania bipapillata TaxID=110536 RepID=A0ACC2J3Y5_9PEZI|nr:hypothetical protein ONZ43_g1538 [Nemania bipapillata]
MLLHTTCNNGRLLVPNVLVATKKYLIELGLWMRAWPVGTIKARGTRQGGILLRRCEEIHMGDSSRAQIKDPIPAPLLRARVGTIREDRLRSRTILHEILAPVSGDGSTAAHVPAAAKSLRAKWKGKREFLIEVSGGLREDNVFDYANNDIDIISTSSIHQGTPHVDFSLKINQGQAAPSNDM